MKAAFGKATLAIVTVINVAMSFTPSKHLWIDQQFCAIGWILVAVLLYTMIWRRA